jgi:protocatechuate 4,5-dioxygenase alpha chain
MVSLKTSSGTVLFGAHEAKEGYPLNRMCFSFNERANRNEFLKDEEAYMEKYGLSEKQKAAIRAKNVLQLLDAGGNAYYLAKFAGIFGLNMQDIGAQQTGVSVDEFKQKLHDYRLQGGNDIGMEGYNG